MATLTKRQLMEIRYDRSHEPGPAGHDAIIDSILALRAQLHRQQIVSEFLASLGGGSLLGRSTLPTYSAVRHLERHSLDAHPAGRYCVECGLYATEDTDAAFIAMVNAARYGGGGFYDDVSSAYANFRLYFEDPPPSPEDSEVNVGVSVIRSFLDGVSERMGEELTFSNYLKEHKKSIPGRNQDERLHFLEMLGTLGILQPPDHPSYRTQWIRAVERAERQMFRSDVRYPVQYWRTSHGYCEEAVEEWFGEWM